MIRFRAYRFQDILGFFPLLLLPSLQICHDQCHCVDSYLSRSPIVDRFSPHGRMRFILDFEAGNSFLEIRETTG